MIGRFRIRDNSLATANPCTGGSLGVDERTKTTNFSIFTSSGSCKTQAIRIISKITPKMPDTPP